MMAANIKLTGNDAVTDQLLSHVSHHVVSRVRKQFATGPLGLSDNQYANIEEDAQYAERRNYEVLIACRNKSFSVTVKDFVALLVSWQQNGYISPEVWINLSDVISKELLPAVQFTSSASVVPSGDENSFLNKIWLVDYQKWNKESVIRRCRNALSTDWLPEDKARTFPLKEYYVQLERERKIKKVLKDEQVSMNRIHDLFNLKMETTCVNILIKGEAGIGKSCSMAMLAMDWAEGRDTEEIQHGGQEPEMKRFKPEIGLLQFDFVFLIQLRYVSKNIPLERVIIQQHSRLKSRKAKEENLRKILDGETGSKVLLLLDGYDEYKKGTNTDIDDAIADTIGDCFLIVTSRPGDYMKKIDRDQLDGEIIITGLSPENIAKCSAKYLDSQELSQSLLHKSREAGIYQLLRVPIILLMVCVLYHSTEELPRRKTDIVWKIIVMCMDRSALKNLGRKSSEITDLDEMLYILGELSWTALRRDAKQLLISKTEVAKAKGEILKLGLLHGTLYDEEASVDEQPEWLTYAHKLFQDFMGGYYACKKFQRDCSKAELQRMFPSWTEIQNVFEVVKFTCGLMDDVTSLVHHISEIFAEHIATKMRTRMLVTADSGVKEMMSIASELKKGQVDPLQNPCFSHINHLPLKSKSRFYIFGSHEEKSKDNNDESSRFTCTPSENESLNTCRVAIIRSKLPPVDILATIANLNQSITELYIGSFRCDEAMEMTRHPVFKIDLEARHVNLNGCKLPVSLQKDLGEQLSRLHRLETLIVVNSPNILPPMVSNLGNMTNLRQLILPSCGLSEGQCPILCQQLRTVPLLDVLDLNMAPIRETGGKYLAESITFWGANPPIKELILKDGNINISGSVSLMQSLTTCRNLKKLVLYSNYLGEAVIQLSGALMAWGPNFPLNWLDLYDCNIDQSGCTLLMTSLSTHTNVSVLRLAKNSIGGAFEALDPGLNYPRLSDLDMPNTSLLKGDILALAFYINNCRMPSLNKLSIGYKNIAQFDNEEEEVLKAFAVMVKEVRAFGLIEGGVSLHKDKMMQKVAGYL